MQSSSLCPRRCKASFLVARKPYAFCRGSCICQCAKRGLALPVRRLTLGTVRSLHRSSLAARRTGVACRSYIWPGLTLAHERPKLYPIISFAVSFGMTTMNESKKATAFWKDLISDARMWKSAKRVTRWDLYANSLMYDVCLLAPRGKCVIPVCDMQRAPLCRRCRTGEYPIACWRGPLLPTRGTIRGFRSMVITYQMALYPRDEEPYDGVAHG